MVPNWGVCALCKGTGAAGSWLIVAMQEYRPRVASSDFFKRSLESRMLWEISYF